MGKKRAFQEATTLGDDNLDGGEEEATDSLKFLWKDYYEKLKAAKAASKKWRKTRQQMIEIYTPQASDSEKEI